MKTVVTIIAHALCLFASFTTTTVRGQAMDRFDDRDERRKTIHQLLSESPRFIERTEWKPVGPAFVRGWLKIDEPEQALLAIQANLERDVHPSAMINSMIDYWLEAEEPLKAIEFAQHFFASHGQLLGENGRDVPILDKLTQWYIQNQQYDAASELADRWLQQQSAKFRKDYRLKLVWRCAKVAASQNDFLLAEELIAECKELRYPEGFLALQAIRHRRYELAMSYLFAENLKRQHKLITAVTNILVAQRNWTELDRFIDQLRLQNESDTSPARELNCRVSAVLAISKELQSFRSLAKSGAAVPTTQKAESKQGAPQELESLRTIQQSWIDSTLLLVASMKYSKVYYRYRRDLCGVLLAVDRIDDAIQVAERNCPTGQTFFSALDLGVGAPFYQWVNDEIAAGNVEGVMDLLKKMENAALQSEATEHLDDEVFKEWPTELRRRFLELDIKHRVAYTRSRDAKEDIRFHYWNNVPEYLLQLGQYRRLQELGQEFDIDYSSSIQQAELVAQIRRGDPFDVREYVNVNGELPNEFAEVVGWELMIQNRTEETIEILRYVPASQAIYVLKNVLDQSNADRAAESLADAFSAVYSNQALVDMESLDLVIYIKKPQVAFAVWSKMADAFPECGWLNAKAAKAAAAVGKDERAIDYAFSLKHDRTKNAVSLIIANPHSSTLSKALIDRAKAEPQYSENDREMFFLEYVRRLVERSEFESALSIRLNMVDPEKKAWASLAIVDGLLEIGGSGE